MKTIRPLLLLAGKFLLIYILLIVLTNTTGCHKLYRDFYVNAATVVAGNVYKNADVKCEKLDNGGGDDIVFTFANKSAIEKAREEARRTGQTKTNIKGFKWSFSTYRVDLMFLLFFIALVLAYPTGFIRKIIGLLIGLFIYYLISFFLLGGRVLFQFHKNKSVFPEYNLSNLSEQFLSTATNMHTEGMFFIAFLIWAVVMVGRDDFRKLKNGF